MKSPAKPPDEKERLEELHGLKILDTEPEERFDRITRLAKRLIKVPIALISLVDADRQWFKSKQGISVLETPREISFCGHAILSDKALVVEDAKQDSRFSDNPLVTGEPRVQFYAGQPLRGPQGHNLGTLCVIDHRPRKLDSGDIETLRDLAALAETELQMIRIHRILDCLVDGIIIFDDQGIIESMNSAGKKMFGWKAEEISGKSIDLLIPDICTKEQKAESSESSFDIDLGCMNQVKEFNGKRQDGSVFPVELAVSFMKWGQKSDLVAIVHDITSRKKVEEQLLVNTAALDAAANGIIITDTKGTIQWINPAFTRLTGYSSDEAVGQNTRFLKSGKQDPAYYKELWQTIKSGKVWQGELINRRKDGTHYHEEMTITPVKSKRGKIQHFISIKQDITDRRAAEEKLQKMMEELEAQYIESEQAQAQMRAILDASSEAMALISPKGKFLAINRQFEQFFSVRKKRVIDQNFSTLLPVFERIFDDPAAIKVSLDESTKNGESPQVEIAVQKWPQWRELEIYSKLVKAARGRHLGILYVFRDVTHEREVDRMKSEFVSLVSHELRTPLTSIVGYVDLLLEGDAGELNDEQTDFLEVVNRNAHRLSMLVTDLLDVSRIESGAIKLKRTELDLQALIQGVVDSMKPQLEAKKQMLKLRIGTKLPVVYADADRITHVLMNLLSNAHKYTPAEGNISISSSVEKDQVCVEVNDTGIGLSLQEQKRLFTKFFRAENPMTQEVSGTGLGLWITRSIVEMHGGEMGVSSTPGKGSTFSFTLPISEDTETEQES